MGKVIWMMWNSRRGDLKRLLGSTWIKGIKMLEVGSYTGESAEVFLSTGLVDSLVCVDTWSPGYDAADIASDSDMAEVERLFDARVLARYPNASKFKGDLPAYIASGNFKPGMFDLVYLDACHEYSHVKNDLECIVNTIKPKFISGHDYSGKTPGVIRAVDEVLGRPSMIFEDSSWIVKVG